MSHTEWFKYSGAIHMKESRRMDIFRVHRDHVVSLHHKNDGHDDHLHVWALSISLSLSHMHTHTHGHIPCAQRPSSKYTSQNRIGR